MSAPVQLALFDLSASAAQAQDWLRLLAPDERRRAASLPAALRWRWTGARAALRSLLAERLGRAPASMRFGCASGGKPFLLDTDGLFFNLAHSGDLVACVLADEPDIGVDLERYDRRLPAPAQWWRFLAAPERAQVGACARRFVRHWVHKEAVMKASGAGVRMGARAICFAADGKAGLQLVAIDREPDLSRWRVAGGGSADYAWAVALRAQRASAMRLVVTMRDGPHAAARVTSRST